MFTNSEAGESATVTLTADLHARPAAQVVRIVAEHEADVSLTVGGRDADARSVLALMGLGATTGQEVTVRAEGPQATQALAAVTELLADLPVEATP
jgi:phosphoenolpyruvate---glycerone phosphotransferase subunit DhaM